MKTAASLCCDRQAKARFDTAEFRHMGATGAFDGMKIELVGGELERMPFPLSEHAARQAQIGIRLSGLLPETRIMGGVGIDLDNDTVLTATWLC